MVGFTHLSDSDESLIDEIISQAKDACVLDQIAAINCSSFTDSVLPTHLETRFRNLKSFPPTKHNHPPPSFTKAHTFSTSHSTTNHNTHLGTPKTPTFSPSKKDPLDKTCFDPEFQNGSVTSPSKPLDSSPVVKPNHSNGKNGLEEKSKLGSVSPGSGSDQSSISSLFKPNPDEEKRRKQKTKSGSLSSPLSNSNSFTSSPSPPRKLGCFWCSPKKDSSSKNKKKKSKENWWDKSDEEFLSDLGSFSSKKQQKILKEAMKEEQKISIEAEKIVRWAKQASARMNVLDIDDELSDH